MENILGYPETVPYNREKLLAPISPTNPVGESLRYEGTYDRIQEARRQEDPQLPVGVWEHELKEADWQLVSTLCTESLEHRTKDLQIAVWMVEAWMHLYGFVGARDGLGFVRDLCATYWSALHPPLEEAEYRLSIFEWMNERLSHQLKFIPITRPAGLANVPAFAYADWEKASFVEEKLRNQTSADDLKASEPEGITIAVFEQSRGLTPAEFFDSLVRVLDSVKTAAQRLEAFLDQQYGKNAPTLRAFRDLPEKVISVVRPVAGPASMAGVSSAVSYAPTASEAEEIAPPRAETTPSAAMPPIRSREEAYQRLAEAADYLFRTEPHSPTPYLVRKAISWGNMPLDELLPELVRNEGALQEAMKLLRIEPRKKAGTENDK